MGSACFVAAKDQIIPNKTGGESLRRNVVCHHHGIGKLFDFLTIRIFLFYFFKCHMPRLKQTRGSKCNFLPRLKQT